jgi:hypothetical protein
MDLNEAVEKIKVNLGNDSGVYHICPGNRFGDQVIAIFCITDQDCDRIITSTFSRFEGFNIYVSSPIWGVGNLLPEYGKKILEVMKNEEKSNIYGTQEQKALETLCHETMMEEKKYWESLSEKAKKEFLNYWIRKERKRIPDFANCGDKFLINE